MHEHEALCTEKIGFTSLEAAKKVAHRGSRGMHNLRRTVYRCQICGLYHLGTKQKVRKMDARRETRNNPSDQES